VVEIVEQVLQKSKPMDTKTQEINCGYVLTGGGAQLKHIKQLVEYITGMDTRIGYPNEHLAGDSDEEFSSPLYATAVGLVMNGIDNQSTVRLK
jgi:cell division protein FtsA